MGSFEKASWASYEIERTGGKIASNMERDILRHHTEILCLNADRITSNIPLEMIQQGIKPSVLLPFSQK
ncbi:hypothetical protein TNCV_4579101 [Trichonephila clavipes]|nr:hypothetical protein TNCV_4579101 [Trichonephila clavipes]